MTKNILIITSSILFIGCSQPYSLEVNNSITTSQLFLIGEMSSNGYKYLGPDSNGTMKFKHRRKNENISFTVKETSDKTSSVSILKNNGVEEKKIEGLMNRVKSYSEGWKDKPKDADNVTYIDNPGLRPIEASQKDLMELSGIDGNRNTHNNVSNNDNDLSYIDNMSRRQ